MSSPASVAIVSIYLKTPSDNDRTFITTLPRSNLELHSAAFRAFLNGNPVRNEMARDVTLPNGRAGALRHVLNIIKTHGHAADLWVNIANLSFDRIVAIWQACDIIQLEPVVAKDRVSNHISYALSHSKVTGEMIAVMQDIMSPAQVDHDREKQRPWRTMVHQYVWDRLHDRYSLQELATIEPIVLANLDLSQAITAKLNDLRPKKEEFDAQRARNHAQAEAQKAAFREERERKRFNKKEARAWQKAREVVAGRREWTAELDWYVNQLRK